MAFNSAFPFPTEGKELKLLFLSVLVDGPAVRGGFSRRVRGVDQLKDKLRSLPSGAHCISLEGAVISSNSEIQLQFKY